MMPANETTLLVVDSMFSAVGLIPDPVTPIAVTAADMHGDMVVLQFPSPEKALAYALALKHLAERALNADIARGADSAEVFDFAKHATPPANVVELFPGARS
jgi:hypothetical protein